MKGPLKEAGRVLSSVGCETCPTGSLLLVGVLIHPFSQPQPKPNPSEENPRLVS